MKSWYPLIPSVLLATSCLCTTSCSNEPGRTTSVKQALAASSPVSTTLSWGTAPNQVGFKPAGPEQLAQGVSSVAVDSKGRVLLLDRLNGRVLRWNGSETQVVAMVPADFEDLVCGPDEGIVTYSPLRHEVRMEGSGGRASMHVPLTLRHVTGILSGPSRRVWLQTALQERFLLGSPSAPLSLAALLRTKAEGAWSLPEGRAVLVTVGWHGASIQVVARNTGITAQRAGARTYRIVKRIELTEWNQTIARGGRLGITIVGTDGTVVCMRADTVTQPRKRIQIRRRLVCIDVASTERVMDQDLGSVGLYAPRRDIAVGAGRVAFILPTRDGLRVTVWPLSSQDVSNAATDTKGGAS
ncbi:MAG: hypothetical protein J7M25_00585 [Deltaproteobacteria bacterium]|nr:hypothetical protein [Deltaproteobacteria bacterium]